MTNAFTLTVDALEQGIALVEGSVALGERGRGRHLAQWTPPQGATIDGDRLLAVPGHDFLVAVRVLHGYRGSATPHWVAGVEPCPSRAVCIPACHVVQANCFRCGTGWFRDGDQLVHPTSGWAPRLVRIQDDDPALLAKGWVVDGRHPARPASPQMLLSVAPGSILVVKRSGLLLGDPEFVGAEVSADGAPTFVAAQNLAQLKLGLDLDDCI